MRRGMFGKALLLGAAGVAGCLPASVSAVGSSQQPVGCRVVLSAASESHGSRLISRCDFAQSRIRITADSRIYDVSPRPTLTGPTDAQDTFHCGNRNRPVALCRGQAGSGVRLGAYVETKEFSCDVSFRVHVTGGTDCDPEPSCDQVGYRFTRRIAQPRGC